MFIFINMSILDCSSCQAQHRIPVLSLNSEESTTQLPDEDCSLALSKPHMSRRNHICKTLNGGQATYKRVKKNGYEAKGGHWPPRPPLKSATVPRTISRFMVLPKAWQSHHLQEIQESEDTMMVLKFLVVMSILALSKQLFMGLHTAIVPGERMKFTQTTYVVWNAYFKGHLRRHYDSQFAQPFCHQHN